MAKNKKESFFWTSYSDLMTSLFFIMLVLFVLCLAILHQNNQKLRIALIGANATIEQQKRLLHIDEQFDPLIKSDIFIYKSDSKKFVVKDFIGKEIFSPNKDIILPEFTKRAIQVGQALEKQLKILAEQNPDFKYQMVIEGNVANKYDYSYPKDGIYGYELSYKRALTLYLLWTRNGIDLRKYNTEIMICGSGWNGEDRENVEENNKRFSIQIIPKISSPKNQK